ncbi:MarR family winged helix-turn-helix transcriptional regulator [Roseateles sp. LKC17W]|uniref:MarR family winged helix-turn-helix transcriptional regulator n=1 Tax=Pelomonas margarita TaxID=3299031 RepID=A0ABW7FIB3_9BURK
MPRTAPSPKSAEPAPRAKARRPRAEPGDVFDFQSNALGYQLRLAQLRAFDLFFEMLAPLDLSPARVTALSLIAMSPGTNQAALAKALNVAGPSALKLVDGLESAGWIRRVEVEGDRRRYSLQLTEQGQARLAQLREKLAEYEARLTTGLSAVERQQLMDLLGRLAR